MTLFGFSTYQARKMEFYAKLTATDTGPFGVRHPFLASVLAVGFFAVLFALHGLFPHLNEVNLFWSLLVLFIVFGLVPLEMVALRAWRKWYGQLSPEDRNEYWWIKKRGFTYLGAVVGVIALYIAILSFSSR